MHHSLHTPSASGAAEGEGEVSAGKPSVDRQLRQIRDKHLSVDGTVGSVLDALREAYDAGLRDNFRDIERTTTLRNIRPKRDTSPLPASLKLDDLVVPLDVRRLLAAIPKLRLALYHVKACSACAEGPWEECEGGREALAVLAEVEGR